MAGVVDRFWEAARRLSPRGASERASKQEQIDFLAWTDPPACFTRRNGTLEISKDPCPDPAKPRLLSRLTPSEGGAHSALAQAAPLL